jgi:hypothetical protein
MKRLSSFLAPLFLVLSILGASCGSTAGTPPHQDYQAWLEQGQAALEQNDATGAHDDFTAALLVRPHDGSASLGLVLADAQSLMILIDDLVNFIASESGSTVSTMAVGDPGGLGPGSTLDDTIHHFVAVILGGLFDEMIQASDDSLTAPDASLYLTSLPFVFQGQTILDLGGQWGPADAQWVAAIVRLGNGGIDYLQSIDLNLNVGPWLASDFFHTLINGGQLDWSSAFQEIVTLAINALEDPQYPDFLLAESDAGPLFQNCQLNLALATIDAVNVGPLVPAETVGNLNQVLGFIDLNNNGVHDPGEPYAFEGQLFPPFLYNALPALKIIGLELFAALSQGTPLDGSPGYYKTFDPFAFNLVLEAWGWPEQLPLIPHGRWDLAAFFAAPPLAQDKETDDKVLHCIADEPDPAAVVVCLVKLFG